MIEIIRMIMYCYIFSDVSPPLTLSLSPATSNPVQAGTSVTFTCTLDANPAPSYFIWTRKWVYLDTNKNSIVLSIQKQHNRIDLYCRADGSLIHYKLYSAHQSFTVECKCDITFKISYFYPFYTKVYYLH